MSARSTACSIQGCKKTSRALCYCCQHNLCRNHFKEHDDILNSQLYPLADEVNVLANELQQINIVKLIDEAKIDLKKWLLEEHRKIDQLYEQKCHDLEQPLYEQYMIIYEKRVHLILTQPFLHHAKIW
jgi:hypothetical protein